jgi:hypothetical protein
VKVRVVAGPGLLAVRGHVPTGGGGTAGGKIVAPGAVMEDASVPPALVTCPGVLVQVEVSTPAMTAKEVQDPVVLFGAPTVPLVTVIATGVAGAD